MSDLTTTLTIDDTDYTINIDNHDDTLTHNRYMNYNEEFDVYLIISYKTRGGEVLNHTVHQFGTKPTIERIPEEVVNRDGIREDIEKKLGTTLTDEQLDHLISIYLENGEQVINNWGLYADELYRHMTSDGYISTNTEAPHEGWGTIIEHTLDSEHEDDIHNAVRTVFNALQSNTPGEHEYVAQIQCGDIESWQLRALELYQNSVLANKPALCKVQALHETGHDYFEISEILSIHDSTVSHQLRTIDEWLEAATWTSKNVADQGKNSTEYQPGT